MSKCLVCKSNNTKVFKSKVAKFLSIRMLNGEEQETDAVFCKDCGFLYYTFRPTDEQMNKLYYRYRDEEYQKQRQSCECWYTPKINELIGNSLSEKETRNKNLENIINKNIEIENINNVLDFGGDKGQHIPNIFSKKEKYVYDISGVEPIAGVNFTDLKDKSKKFDFVMCCHLLEHVCSPQQIIEQIKSLMSNESYLYIELPFDSPFYANKFEIFQFLFNKYFTFPTLLKHFIKTKSEKCFKPMHEHINFFTPQSITKLLEDFGFEILYNDIFIINSEWCKTKTISTLAKYKH